MKHNTRRWLTSACTIALIANSALGVAAQEPRRQVEKAETIYFVQQSDKTVTVEGQGSGLATFTFRTPEPGGFAQGWMTHGGQEFGLGSGAFDFFSFGMSFDTREVKGSPYSAESVSETVQTLADGNRIVQRTEGRLYRDGQGRTRQERTFRQGGSNTEKQMISIYDPVAGAMFTLDPQTRTASKMNIFKRTSMTGSAGQGPAMTGATTVTATDVATAGAPKKISVSGGVLQGTAIHKVQPPYPPIAKAARASGAVQVQVGVNEAGYVIDATVLSGHPLLREAAVEAAKQWQFKPTELGGTPVKVQGVLTFNFTLEEESALPLAGRSPMIATGATGGSAQGIRISTNVEKLGTRVVEGVECEGTRSVATLPAGAIGNESPIQTITESWYSNDLKMTIMTKRSDPRFGESTYRVTNIVRAEPDGALFQVPNDYTVKEGPSSFNFNTIGPAGFGGAWTNEPKPKKTSPDQR
jgi:TonB family protein